ncbi:hypothetical protein [Microcystis sp. Msp_OC_L_20101000_S702]|uniref:hypothetical protein n=1 Tax=Microcystis sp. Msp_OC_L_20101000_S702 TaxID=2486218 RepID=UPI00257E38CC|nr:hypothetical protein [Microcystis sp. Msp_OC_L_20101000_S702]
MMNQKITAIFNGEAFYPTETFNLKPNTKVKLTIETQLIDEEQLQIMADDQDILAEIATINGSSVCVMQLTGVIRDGTLIEKGI